MERVMKTNSANRMSDTATEGDARNTRTLSRLAELFRRRVTPSYRMAPPLRNAHYLGVHIAAASNRSLVR
jgi:hypothetical protein